MTRAVWAALLLGLAAAAPTPAQERADGHQLLPEDQWRLPAAAAGKRYFVEGRWHECWRDTLSLFRAEGSRDLLKVQPGSALQLALATNELTDGTKLVPERSRVRVFGTAERQGGKVVLAVTRVDRLEDDDVRLRRALEALGDRADADALAGLAREVRALGEQFGDPTLRALALEASRREVSARLEALGADDHAGALALADRMAAAGDRDGAIELCARVEGGGAPAAREAARERLARLRAVQAGGRWVAFEAYKRAEGFVLRPPLEDHKTPQGLSSRIVEGAAPRWVRRELAELEEARRAELELRLGGIVEVRSNPGEMLAQAQARRLARGQSLAEARLAAGAPVVVHHLRALDSEQRDALWTGWAFADGRRAYFLNGELITARAQGDPWPSSR